MKRYDEYSLSQRSFRRRSFLLDGFVAPWLFLFVVVESYSLRMMMMLLPKSSVSRMSTSSSSSSSSRALHSLLATKRVAESDSKEEWDLDQVSDAEALLACRAFLQRTNQLEEWKKRPRQNTGGFWENPSELRYFHPTRRTSFPSNTTKSSSQSITNKTLHSIEGTFYCLDASLMNTQNDYEERTLDPAATNLDVVDGDIVVAEVAMSTMPFHITGSSPLDSSSSSSFQWNSPIDSDAVWDLEDEDSSIALLAPPPSYDPDDPPVLRHQRRSRPAQQRFQNATWKAQWYQRRWGQHHRRSTVLSSLERRARRIPASFLAQLSVWTEDQLAAALGTYAQANRRRSRSRIRTNQRRRQFLSSSSATRTASNASDLAVVGSSQYHYHDAAPRAPDDAPPKVFSSFLVPDRPSPASHWQLQQQERRAAQAQRAYQQRSPPKKPAARSIPVVPQDSWQQQPSGAADTPKEAVMRMSQMLERQPSLEPSAQLYHCHAELTQLLLGVQTVLRPTKLAYRKEILQRILNDVFHLRGKCVPRLPDHTGTPSSSAYQFVTKASVEELGSFLVTRMQQRLLELSINHPDPIE